MILNLIYQYILFCKQVKGQSTFGMIGKILLVLIGAGILIGLIAIWHNKTIAQIDNTPEFIKGLS